jgi:hypothetical protein
MEALAEWRGCTSSVASPTSAPLAEHQRLLMRQCNRLPRKHRASFGEDPLKFASERRSDGADVVVADPTERRRERTGDAFEQLFRRPPQSRRSVGESSGGKQACEHFEAPGDAAWILEFLAEEQRLGCLQAPERILLE